MCRRDRQRSPARHDRRRAVTEMDMRDQKTLGDGVGGQVSLGWASRRRKEQLHFLVSEVWQPQYQHINSLGSDTKLHYAQASNPTFAPAGRNGLPTTSAPHDQLVRVSSEMGAGLARGPRARRHTSGVSWFSPPDGRCGRLRRRRRDRRSSTSAWLALSPNSGWRI